MECARKEKDFAKRSYEIFESEMPLIMRSDERYLSCKIILHIFGKNPFVFKKSINSPGNPIVLTNLARLSI